MRITATQFINLAQGNSRFRVRLSTHTQGDKDLIAMKTRIRVP